jgi:hypothetical protein
MQIRPWSVEQVFSAPPHNTNEKNQSDFGSEPQPKSTFGSTSLDSRGATTKLDLGLCSIS